VLSAFAVEASVRSPAVAGAFYTDDAAALRLQVEQFLDRAGPVVPGVRAAVAPHAGLMYSGQLAATALASVGASEPKTVILLGPSHYMGFEGGALPAPGVTAFATPLGKVPLDTDRLKILRKNPDFDGPHRAHDREHCLEVELPFLQIVAPEARVVPVLVGFDTDRETARRMARALTEIIDENTVVVASTDFTHHGERYRYAPFDGRKDLGDALLNLGRATADRIAAMDPDGFWNQVEVSGDTVCGRRPIGVLTELLAHAFDGKGSVLGVNTSGHISGSFDLSVTYASVVFAGSWNAWTDQPEAAVLGTLTDAQQHALLTLARATLNSHLAHDQSLANWYAMYGDLEGLDALAGAFVTVHNTGKRAKREGKLRACMGVIEAKQPAADAVMSAAVSAVYDPRFPRLQLDELDEMELEVSILSPTHEVPKPEDIEVGVHGVVLRKGKRSAVYLPQVAPEQGWSREEMLDNLARKAGLPSDGWHQGTTFEVFTAQVFSEDP
jgi:AmmeMemoRadiSam system protein B/AmmeMemoRadiSam system protein A